MKTEKVLWRKKYITVLILSLLILAAVLYGIRNGRRNDKGGNILAGASPDTSAFQMYYFDGETVAVRTLYDSGAEKEVIKKINGIPLQAAEEDALSQMEPPFYGFWVSSQVHWSTKIGHFNCIFLHTICDYCPDAYVSLYCFGVKYPSEYAGRSSLKNFI